MSYQREYKERLRTGIVGVGSHCYRNILPLMNYLPVELIAVCDVNEELVTSTAKQYGCRGYTSSSEMYEREKLDAVFISVGPTYHPQLVLEAFSHGVNVWVEKPIATRAEQVRELIQKRGDNIAVAGLKKAFSPACGKIVEIVSSPDYGHLESMLAVYPMAMESDGAAVLDHNGTPNWLRNGVHPLSFLMRIGGSVHSVQTILNEAGKGDVILKFCSGVLGTLHFASGPKPDFELYEFYGDTWRARVEKAKVSLDRGVIPFEYKQTTDFAPAGFDSGVISWEAGDCVATLENKALFTQGFFNEAMYFCNCVLEHKIPEEGSLEFACEVMDVYEAALLSSGKEMILKG